MHKTRMKKSVLLSSQSCPVKSNEIKEEWALETVES